MRRRFSELAFVTSVVAVGTAGLPASAQNVIPLSSTATYLRTSDDPQATNAVPISLEQLGIGPGDTITVRIHGDLSYCYACGWPEEPVWLAGGVFSSSSAMLPSDRLNRVPGAQAIRQGSSPPCTSLNTYREDLATDIPEDFGFSTDEGATVKVPPGAHWLFVAVVDSFYGDNADPNGNLAVQVDKALVAIPLNILWRVVPWEPDRMTTTGGEELQYPVEGQVFYVAADSQEAGTTTIYRFTNGPDHRDSSLTELPDYWNEGPLGFPWTSNSLPGLSPMVEGFNPESGDYSLMQPGEQLAGYMTEPLGVFGYKRYYNQEESLLALTKGNVTVESNRVFGGAVWRWTWNGTQFLSNNWNCCAARAGMMTLIDMELDGSYRQMNEDASGWLQGSPLVTAQNHGSTQLTRSVPLDQSRSTPENPFLWRDAVVGKNLTLDFNGMDGVAKYTSYVSLPAPIPTSGLYHPIVDLRAEFDRFYVYRADSDLLEDVTSIVPDGCIAGDRYGTPLAVGGGIVADSTGNHALGIYTDNRASIDTPDGLDFGKYYCSPEDTSQNSSTVLVYRGGSLPAGESTFNSYVVTGSLNDVKEKMRQLFVSGAK